MNYEERLENINKKLEELMADKKSNWQLIGELKFERDWLKQTIEKNKIRAIRLRSDSGIGDRFLKYTFENFEEDLQERAFASCKRYAKNFPDILLNKSKNSIVLFGSCGTGKTHLSAAISNYLIDNHGIPVLYGTWSGHLNTLKKGFETNYSYDYLARMMRVPLLIIDDYGQEKNTEWAKEIMFDVINHRYMDNLPIIITTNLDNKAFAENVGDAIMSRLVEISVFINMNGKDYRTR